MHTDLVNFVTETSQLQFLGIEVFPTKDGDGLKALTQGDLLTAIVLATEEAVALGNDQMLDGLKEIMPGATITLVNNRWYVLE